MTDATFSSSIRTMLRTNRGLDEFESRRICEYMLVHCSAHFRIQRKVECLNIGMVFDFIRYERFNSAATVRVREHTILNAITLKFSGKSDPLSDEPQWVLDNIADCYIDGL